ncbi:hypothetical protein GCM10027075_29070 [Streptomyces heilongjiangensis]
MQPLPSALDRRLLRHSVTEQLSQPLSHSATQPIVGGRPRCRRIRCEVAVFRELLTRHIRPLLAALLAVAALMALAGAVPR